MFLKKNKGKKIIISVFFKEVKKDLEGKYWKYVIAKKIQNYQKKKTFFNLIFFRKTKTTYGMQQVYNIYKKKQETLLIAVQTALLLGN